MFQSFSIQSNEKVVIRRPLKPPRIQDLATGRRVRQVVAAVLILTGIISSRTAPAQQNETRFNATADAAESSAGDLRRLSGKHLNLTSDTGSDALLKDLVDAFDAAVGQWERFWQLPDGALDDWTVDGFLIENADRFRQTGDLPAGLNFPFGYATDGNVWVMRQSSDYYTRHLLLHEGAHALQIHLFGGTGPSWYAEGMAELLGVHGGTGSDVRVGVVPASREAAAYWGRFKLMDATRRAGKVPTLDSVLGYPSDLKSDVESYGWSWAAVSLLTQYDAYRSITLRAAGGGSDHTAAFTRALRQQLDPVWPIVQARWRVLTATMDYGYDWSREQVDLAISDPLWSGNALDVTVRADAGWQSAGVRIPPGARVSIAATGRCVLDDDPKPWISEPPGVTIHYANERPLGQLLVAVVPNQTTERDRLQPLEVHAVDPQCELQIAEHSWLLFRINDRLDDLRNNRGGYRLRVRRAIPDSR